MCGPFAGSDIATAVSGVGLRHPLAGRRTDPQLAAFYHRADDRHTQATIAVARKLAERTG